MTPREKRIKKYENTPVCTKLRKETILKLKQIKEQRKIDKADFVRKCIEFGVDNPDLIDHR